MECQLRELCKDSPQQPTRMAYLPSSYIIKLAPHLDGPYTQATNLLADGFPAQAHIHKPCMLCTCKHAYTHQALCDIMTALTWMAQTLSFVPW